jgi:hypothetical protein
MNEHQVNSLKALLSALTDATESGALDIVSGACSDANSVNDVCDAVVQALAQEAEVVG